MLIQRIQLTVLDRSEKKAQCNDVVLQCTKYQVRKTRN